MDDFQSSWSGGHQLFSFGHQSKMFPSLQFNCDQMSRHNTKVVKEEGSWSRCSPGRFLARFPPKQTTFCSSIGVLMWRFLSFIGFSSPPDTCIQKGQDDRHWLQIIEYFGRVVVTNWTDLPRQLQSRMQIGALQSHDRLHDSQIQPSELKFGSHAMLNGGGCLWCAVHGQATQRQSCCSVEELSCGSRRVSADHYGNESRESTAGLSPLGPGPKTRHSAWFQLNIDQLSSAVPSEFGASSVCSWGQCSDLACPEERKLLLIAGRMCPFWFSFFLVKSPANKAWPQFLRPVDISLHWASRQGRSKPCRKLGSHPLWRFGASSLLFLWTRIQAAACMGVYQRQNRNPAEVLDTKNSRRMNKTQFQTILGWRKGRVYSPFHKSRPCLWVSISSRRTVTKQRSHHYRQC